jgi:hypothetical protein
VGSGFQPSGSLRWGWCRSPGWPTPLPYVPSHPGPRARLSLGPLAVSTRALYRRLWVACGTALRPPTAPSSTTWTLGTPRHPSVRCWAGWMIHLLLTHTPRPPPPPPPGVFNPHQRGVTNQEALQKLAVTPSELVWVWTSQWADGKGPHAFKSWFDREDTWGSVLSACPAQSVATSAVHCVCVCMCVYVCVSVFGAHRAIGGRPVHIDAGGWGRSPAAHPLPHSSTPPLP